MKLSLLFFSIFFTLNLKAQKVALLSSDFKQPIIYTDSVTVEQISSGYFAVSTNNFDTLYANLKYLKEILEVRQRAKMQSFELRAGTTIIYIERIPAAYGDLFSIIAKTKTGEIISILNLNNLKKSSNKNADKIQNLMEYISTNKSLFKSPYEIKPKMYNIVVITE